MTHWQTNLSALRMRNPYLANHLEELRSETMSAENLPGQNPIPNVHFALKDKPRLLVINGLGDGQVMSFFLTAIPGCVQHILIVEREAEVFLNLMQQMDFSSLITSASCEFMVGIDESSFMSVLHQYFANRERLIDSGRMRFVHDTQSLARHGDYYLKFAQSLPRAIESLRSIFTSPGEDAYRGLANLVNNIQAMSRSRTLGHCKNIFTGHRGIIVSAGPSLDMHMDHLSRVPSSVVVAAVDGALKSLLAKGVRPHLVFCVERVAATGELLGNLPRDFDVPLVTLPVIDSRVLQNYPGPVIMISRGGSFGPLLMPDEDVLEVGANVAAFALRVLAYLGCEHISLLGQDLAFARDSGKTHAEGVAAVAVRALETMRAEACVIELCGNDGNPIASTPPWQTALRDLSFIISRHRLSVDNVIPLVSGARIPGASQLDPEKFWKEMSAISQHPDARVLLEQKLFSATEIMPVQHTAALLERAREYLSQVETQCQHLMHHISLYQHRHLPAAVLPDELAAYGPFFDSFEEQSQEIVNIDRTLYENLLLPMVGAGDIQILSQWHDQRQNETLTRSAVENLLRMAQAWLEHVAHWARRTLYLLEGEHERIHL